MSGSSSGWRTRYPGLPTSPQPSTRIARPSTRSAGRRARGTLPASRATTRTGTSRSICSPSLLTQRRPARPGSAAPPWHFPPALQPIYTIGRHLAEYQYLALVGRALSALADLGTLLLVYALGRRMRRSRGSGKQGSRRSTNGIRSTQSRNTQYATRNTQPAFSLRPSTPSPFCPSSSATSLRWMRS